MNSRLKSTLLALKTPLIGFAGLMLFGVIADVALDSFIQLMVIYVLINSLFAMSLNLVNGYTGQFSLGHAGFLAVGAYCSAFLAKNFGVLPGTMQLVSFLIYTAAGGLLAAFAGYLVGLPSLRLRGDYLAIVTLGFGEIIRVVILNTPIIGGASGYNNIPGISPVAEIGLSKFLLSYSHAIFWNLACFYVIWRLMKSCHGRAFLSVREDEVAAEAMGVNTTKTKVRAFVLSSFFAGVAGAIFAHYATFLSPSSFGFNRSVDAVIMVVLGGMGSLSGSVLAAIFITVLPELLRPLQQMTGVDLRLVIYALSLILLMILRPQGILGKYEIWDKIPFLKKWSKTT
jgi:branched-chain amino acid transport system permease protein